MVKYDSNEIHLNEYEIEKLKHLKGYLEENDFNGALKWLYKNIDYKSFGKLTKALVILGGLRLEYIDKLYNSMFYNTDVIDIVIPKNIKEVEFGVFQSCPYSINVYISSNSTYFYIDSFSGCKINKLSIPKQFQSYTKVFDNVLVNQVEVRDE